MTKVFIVEESYQGYVRGVRRYKVKAKDSEQAINIFSSGELLEDENIRDDTETTDIDVIDVIED